MRQAIFDIIMHAPWGGRSLLEGAAVLDAFAGTGAMGLEALSRGAGMAVFMDRDRAALAALRANVAACRAGDRVRVMATDVLRPPPGAAQRLVFLDPPYGQNLVDKAIAALQNAGWIIPNTILVAETAQLEVCLHSGRILAERVHGAGQVTVWQAI